MAGSLFSYEAIERPHANIVAKVSSDEVGRAKIDELLETTRDEVRATLSEHRRVVEGLRDALLDREELIGEEITEAIVAVARQPELRERSTL